MDKLNRNSLDYKGHSSHQDMKHNQRNPSSESNQPSMELGWWRQSHSMNQTNKINTHLSHLMVNSFQQHMVYNSMPDHLKLYLHHIMWPQ